MEVKRLRARGMPMETVVVTFRGMQVTEAVTFGPLGVGGAKGLAMWKLSVRWLFAVLHAGENIRSWRLMVASA